MERSLISFQDHEVHFTRRASGLLVRLLWPFTAIILACGVHLIVLAETLPGQTLRPDPQIPTYTISDAAVRAAPTWVLDSVPSVTIGLGDGPEEYLFGMIVGAKFLPNGRIAVADEQYRNIRIYTAEGVHVRTFGRAGGGPGEFQWLTALDVLSDGAIATWDMAKTAVAVFDPSGELVREWRAIGCSAAPIGHERIEISRLDPECDGRNRAFCAL